ncbi:YciI family protein [Guptibacillus algicola]|uniref:YciI family protein n=1 Tax=Guptibacillus algicola TaxID=225844 RepID=UPI001CD54F9F|nr:YciI family protein [Alkalihalobacillus algicola]MCA0988547.1 YciI family protein [Alkalihalobacillus algicola]
MNHFLYKLKLIPELLDEKNWTKKENNIVSEHFNALQQLLKENTLIMAGRTMNGDESAFGIVVIQTNSEEEATAIMKKDPAVREGIMTAELFPYRVALYNDEFNVNQTS